MYGRILGYLSQPAAEEKKKVQGPQTIGLSGLKMPHSARCACLENRVGVVGLINDVRSMMKQERTFAQATLWIYDSFCHEAPRESLDMYIFGKRYDNHNLLVMACAMLTTKMLLVDTDDMSALSRFVDVAKELSFDRYPIVRAEEDLFAGLKCKLALDHLPARTLDVRTGWITAAKDFTGGIQAMQMMESFYKTRCMFQYDPNAVVEATCARMRELYPRCPCPQVRATPELAAETDEVLRLMTMTVPSKATVV